VKTDTWGFWPEPVTLGAAMGPPADGAAPPTANVVLLGAAAALPAGTGVVGPAWTGWGMGTKPMLGWAGAGGGAAPPSTAVAGGAGAGVPVTKVTWGTVMNCVVVWTGPPAVEVMVWISVMVVQGTSWGGLLPLGPWGWIWLVLLAGGDVAGTVGVIVGISVMEVGTSVQMPGFWGTNSAQIPAK
jgi:hypothetical protein